MIVTLVVEATVGPLLELLELASWGSCSWKVPLLFAFLHWVNLKREFKNEQKQVALKAHLFELFL